MPAAIEPNLARLQERPGFFAPVTKWWNWLVFPTSAPTDALRRIDAAAGRGLEKAAELGVKSELVGAQLQKDLDGLLGPAASVEGPPVGSVAKPLKAKEDPKVAKAPTRLQDQKDKAYWQAQMNDNRVDLSKKLSAFTTLIQMRDRCGVKEDNNLGLMNLVKIATTGDKPPSLWKLFMAEYSEKHNLSLFQKFKAALFYWFYYMTSLISKTVETYLGEFITDLTKNLSVESSNTRSLVFRKFLENVNQFLVEDMRATEDFAYKKEHGDLKDIRDRAIERHYGFSLTDLCKAFSEKMVDKASPEVPFFETFHNIPVIGHIFLAFQWFVNRFIIRSNMKSWIVPNALESAVTNGIEATQPHNLPFSLSITRFLTERLEQLRSILEEEEGSPPKPPGTLAGTELLPSVIKNLELVLKLEEVPHVALELRKKFEEIETEKKGFWDKKVDPAIEKGIVDACNLLFKYLNETTQSGELFARALLLAAAPFSGEVKDQELLNAEYKEEQIKLERTAKEVFTKIVKKAVAEEVGGAKPEDTRKIAQETFDARKTIADTSLDRLDKLCEQMVRKIESAQVPTGENNIQADIAAFSQIMRVFANRKEVQDEIENLSWGVDRNAIWNLVTPIYEKAATLQERILKLQKLQDEHPAMATVENQLKEIRNLLKTIHDPFPSQSNNPFLVQTLGQSAETILPHLKASDAPQLQRMVQDIAVLSDRLAKEQKMIDAIIAFYPPRLDGQEVQEEGLLDQLLNYQRGIQPERFKPLGCLNEIRRYLQAFPSDEQKRLRELIGNGTNLKAKWAELGEVLQTIYQNHLDFRKADRSLLDQALERATRWTQIKLSEYTQAKEDDYDLMLQEIRAISSDVSELRKDAAKSRLNFGSVPIRGKKVGLAALGAAIGVGFGLLGPVGAALGAATAIAARNVGGLRNMKPVAMAKAVLAGGAAGAASAFIPGAALVIAPAVDAAAGWNYEAIPDNISDEVVFPKVNDIFKSAYKLCQASRIYKMAATRTLKTISES